MMSLSEFKFWLEGFVYSIDKAPSQEQWEEVLRRLNEAVPAPTNLPYPPTSWGAATNSME